MQLFLLYLGGLAAAGLLNSLSSQTLAKWAAVSVFWQATGLLTMVGAARPAGRPLRLLLLLHSAPDWARVASWRGCQAALT